MGFEAAVVVVVEEEGVPELQVVSLLSDDEVQLPWSDSEVRY